MAREPLVDVARRVVVEGVAGRVLVLAVWLLVDEDAELVLLLVKAVLEVDWLVLKKIKCLECFQGKATRLEIY